MCGRFTLTVDPGQLQEAFPWVILAALGTLLLEVLLATTWLRTLP